jgi:hypothetical protein
MVNGRREFSILDGGFKFDYLVLDEVHTLDGPEVRSTLAHNPNRASLER